MRVREPSGKRIAARVKLASASALFRICWTSLLLSPKIDPKRTRTPAVPLLALLLAVKIDRNLRVVGDVYGDGEKQVVVPDPGGD